LHKSVFQENLLEDGAAVGYFDHEKVDFMRTCSYIHFLTINFSEYVFHVLAETIEWRN